MIKFLISKIESVYKFGSINRNCSILFNLACIEWILHPFWLICNYAIKRNGKTKEPFILIAKSRRSSERWPDDWDNNIDSLFAFYSNTRYECCDYILLYQQKMWNGATIECFVEIARIAHKMEPHAYAWSSFIFSHTINKVKQKCGATETHPFHIQATSTTPIE